MGYARFRRPLDAATSCGLVRALAAEAVCERLDLAGPPPVAARRDRNRVGEVRAVRQLVGCGPAKLEERADVPDADQIVAGPPGWPGSRGRGDCLVWRAAHALPLATTWSGGSAIIASAASARSWVPVGEREVVGVLDLVRVPCRVAAGPGHAARRVGGGFRVRRPWCGGVRQQTFFKDAKTGDQDQKPSQAGGTERAREQARKLSDTAPHPSAEALAGWRERNDGAPRRIHTALWPPPAA